MSSKRKFCINCGKDIPAEAAYCPFCSAMQLDVLPKPAPQNKARVAKEENKPDNKQEGPSNEKPYPSETTASVNENGEIEHVYKRNQTSSEQIVPKSMRVAYRTERQEMTGSEKDELMKKAYTDSVTGFASRAKLDERMRNASPNDIIVIGVLNVVNYNSTVNAYGRETGDKLLKDAAEIIGEICPRETFRIEGGEFVIVLFNHTINDLQRRMADIINLFGDRSVKNRNSKDKSEFYPEVSYGMTELKHGEAFSAGLRRAEADALDDLKSSIVKSSGSAAKNYDYIDDEPAVSASKTQVRGNERRTARDEYRSQKRSYSDVLAKRITETVILGVILVAVILLKNHFGC